MQRLRGLTSSAADPQRTGGKSGGAANGGPVDMSGTPEDADIVF